jgi:hypothetical protein
MDDLMERGSVLPERTEEGNLMCFGKPVLAP